MPRRTTGLRRDDLFDLFPDFPALPPRSRAEQVARMRRLAIDMRERAAKNILRQKETNAALRRRVVERQAVMLASRPPLTRRRRS